MIMFKNAILKHINCFKDAGFNKCEQIVDWSIGCRVDAAVASTIEYPQKKHEVKPKRCMQSEGRSLIVIRETLFMP